MESKRPLQSISDDELLRRLADLMQQSRRVESDLVAHIAEVDERRLYAREASPSMFAYCMEILHLSEAEAYLRIAAARASREHPMLLAMLADGRLHLTGIAKLAPHLTPENRDALLMRASHRSKRQVEELIAQIAPRPDVPPVMRKLPERKTPPVPPPSAPDRAEATVLELRPGGVDAAPAAGSSPAIRLPAGRPALGPQAPVRFAIVEPLAPARYRVQFTAGAELHDKLERLQALMRSEVPDGDLATIIERAVTEKLERLEAKRYAKTEAPRKTLTEGDASPSSRHVPAAVRRAVHERDGDRCGYVDAQGRRCSGTIRLELHHHRPFGLGGDHSLQNVGLRCRVHNQYLAECDYGKEVMARNKRKESGARASGAPLATSSP